MTLDARGFGKPRPCRSCGATVTVAWGRDPHSRKTVPVAMTQAPRKPATAVPAPAAPGAPSQVQDTVKAFCSSGHSKRVPAAQRSNPPRCLCGKLMRIEEVPSAPAGKIQKFERAKPSAPLLPLHLRAPLKTRVKKGVQFFDCVCGERVLIRAGSEGRPIQCAGCDRFHLLDIEGEAPPPTATPVTGAAPRGAAPPPPPPPPRPLGLGEFLCQCGEIQPPRTSRTGREFTCKKCGRKGHVEADKDPETGLPKMRPIFTSGPTPAAAPPPAPGKPAAPAIAPPPQTVAPSWTCPCGASIEVHVVMAKSDAACPTCGRKIKLEKWRQPVTGRTVFKPVFGDPALAPPAAAVTAPKPAEDLVSFEMLEPMEASLSDTAMFETAAGSDGGDAPPAVDADAQVVPCECGAEILLSVTDIGHTIQCPACADMMIVEGNRDARSGNTMISLRIVGALDDPDWKLEEFQ